MEVPAGSITLRVRNATIPAMMKARVHALRTNKEDNAIRRELVAKAAAIEPDNPEVWLYQAWGHWREYQNGWSDDREASFDKAAELAEKADAADPGDSAMSYSKVRALTRAATAMNEASLLDFALSTTAARRASPFGS